MFTEKDLEQLKEKGISVDMAKDQIRNFEKGFPFIKLASPATPGDGIIQIDQDQLKEYVEFYDEKYPALDIVKFVPASGAATRMFKDLFTWRDELRKGKSAENIAASDKQAAQFFAEMETFAFWDDLKNVLNDKGLDANALLEKKDYLSLIDHLLDDDGLGYAMLPKGLLRFHKYKDFSRTPLEEHLVEGANYVRKSSNVVKLHFTVSPEHRGRFINHVGSVIKSYEENFGTGFEVRFSVQKPSTDTMAVDLENNPFRDSDGSLLFRPGGHGALIQNLNELTEDLVFIKNIDNVVPDRLKEETYTYKKLLGGLLLFLQEKVFRILREIDGGNFADDEYAVARTFAIEHLCIDEKILPHDDKEGISLLRKLLDRPIRICGMVKNVGEPGGGPFWVQDPRSGIRSLQIVESSQVDHKDAEQKKIFEQSTHFNPVDLVCSLKDHTGKAYDLAGFVDPETGFISYKSKDGKDLKAQELPGLWNGAMANWNTIFVEVPLITFNPVKTIMDLLREEHR
ncbi:MAG: DUF4301 family protein [Bacteroidales bacterium]|nr:DUF4301 family protein [Bacteroidales bacterium]